MKRLKTKNQEKALQYASRLEILRELDKREALGEELKKEYQALENRMWARIELENWIQKCGKQEWSILEGFSFVYGTEVLTCDLMLIANHQIHCFDIDTRLRDQSLLDLEKVKSTAPFIQEIFRQADYEVDVNGYVLYLQEPLEWMTQHLPSSSSIISRNQLRQTIEEIAAKDFSPQEKIDYSEIFELLEKEEFKLAYEPKSIDEETLTRVRPGICCSHCGHFDIEIDVDYVTCACGMHEPLEEAIVRTICEYGVIHNHLTYFEPAELFDFFDGDITIYQLMFYLAKHFAVLDR